MTAAEKIDRVSVEDYLASEEASEMKREYLGGVVYAMSGARRTHNRICANATAALHAGLSGFPCEVLTSDMKVRIDLATHTRFYYPDVVVACDDRSSDELYLQTPALVIEVLSQGTRRADISEKKDAYLSLPSLNVLMYVEQDRPEARIYRRGREGFEGEAYRGIDAVVPLPEFGTQLLLAKLYERVEFGPEEPEAEPR